MKKFNPASLVLIGGISVFALTGCEQIEQAANEAVDKVKQSAVRVLDEARQAGSVDEARQSADRAVQEARQTAAELFGQASEFLSDDPNAPGEDPSGEASASGS